MALPAESDYRPDALDRRVAGLAAVAIAIHVLEAGFPSPVPGIKPGLANVVTLVALLRHGVACAAWVAGLRVLVGSLLVGSFLTPTFWLSATGAVSAFVVLAAAYAVGRAVPALRLSAVGLSVLAAMAHMTGQFMVAWTVFLPHAGLTVLLPVLLAAALVFGLASGLVALRVLDRMQRLERAPEAGGY
ncbi:Gx transporter family protein [Algiphilus sp.]|uniref:Gx transporter family protein n=1 Tax=Algiphilus sp. TaxID=1872431 RepID=UPI002A61F7DD|nr:Gx transporter family protein [Pseudomonadota bacterium]